jgi:hypothetical protein
MAFDCIFVDFQVEEENRKKILSQFPYARTTPFVSSYFDILKSFIEEIQTEFFWLVSDLVYLEQFDFNYIPEQFQKNQIHVWHNKDQKEGNIFLVPTHEFKKQINTLKFLRDFKDINYHLIDLQEYQWPKKQFNYGNLYKKINEQNKIYTYYFYNNNKHCVVPSFWEDLKLYVGDQEHLSLTIPKMKIRDELYDYDNIYILDSNNQRLNFNIFFLHNNESVAHENFITLKEHLRKIDKVSIELQGIEGRDLAIKKCAEISETEYFYVVPAKLEIDPSFKFDYTPSTLKTNRHYIFGCYNQLIDYMYGHQAIVLYYKENVLKTTKNVLDFTLSQPHEYINQRSGTTTFFKDSKINYRTTFREVVKLLYQKQKNPTVETNYILDKWLIVDNIFTKRACQDAKNYCESVNYSYDELIKSFDWKFVDNLFLKNFN